MTSKVFVSVAAMIFLGSAASAQAPADGGPDPARVRVRIGPLWLNPTIALTNLGVDNNVFNEPDDASPKKDFTVTVTPQIELWMHMGRTWVTSVIKEDAVWFKKYASQRSANSSYTLGWRVPLNRLTFSTTATWLNTRERPGFEIDARSQRTETTYGGTAEIRALSKTFVGVTGQRVKVNFDKGAVFLGNSLHDELTRAVTSGALTLRHQLTPLTSVTFSAGRSQDRFRFSPLRDSDSTTYDVAVTFDPFALIKGGASFGYRDFEPRATGLPNYKGSTANVDLAYTLLASTRFGVQAIRSVQYSYDVNQPYYLLTGVNASLAQQIFGPVDVVGRIGVQRLEYRDRAGAVIQVSNRTDYVRSYGGGVGYRMGRDVRLGVNIDQHKRTSALSARQYTGLRIGAAVTYGL